MSSFETITVKELHPTFAAEVQGVNFKDLSDKQFDEVVAALAKVCPSVLPLFGLLLSPNSMVSAFSATPAWTIRHMSTSHAA